MADASYMNGHEINLVLTSSECVGDKSKSPAASKNSTSANKLSFATVQLGELNSDV